MPIDPLPQLASASIRALALGLIALAGLWLFRVRSSAVRHATWTIVLAGMLLQIPLGVVTPTVRLKALPAPAVPVEQHVTESAPIPLPPVQRMAPGNQPIANPVRRWPSANVILTALYLAISLLLLMRMALGSLSLHRILRGAKPIASLGPGIFESPALAAPGSVGCFRARILLPPGWKNWDAAKLGAVLAHESAHIRRLDWLIRVAARVNVCVFWFHPLAWWMERELARLAEEVCDDVALSVMADGEEYAAILLDIARAAARAGVLNWQVISMAKDSNIIRRVNRILSRELPIPKPFGRLAWLALFVCSVPVIYLSAAVQLAAVPTRAAAVARQTPIPDQEPSLTEQLTPRPHLSAVPPATRSQPQDMSVTLCLLIDNSGSMRGKRPAVEAAALGILRASQPHDEVCIVDFNDETYLDLDFTRDVRKMEETLTHIDARGGKRMRDAVGMSLDHFEQAPRNGRKALVLITEGNDSASAITQEQLVDMLRKNDVRVYSMGLVSEDDPSRGAAARLALRQIADASGGRAYYPRDLAEVESIVPQIAKAVRDQGQPVATVRPRFEVASLKPDKGCENAPKNAGSFSPSPTRLEMPCMSLGNLIETAYGTFGSGVSINPQPLHVEGVPSWMQSEYYSLAAKTDEPARVEMLAGPMLQSLLEERLRLKTHWETREMPVYQLTEGKGGLKVRPLPQGACSPLDLRNPPPLPKPADPAPNVCSVLTIRPSGNGNIKLEVSASTMTQLAQRLSRFLDRTVVDKSGIAGLFNFHVEFTPDPNMPGQGFPIRGGDADNPVPPADAGPNLFTALQEQLGLKLEPAKGPVDVLVIDHVERPTAN